MQENLDLKAMDMADLVLLHLKIQHEIMHRRCKAVIKTVAAHGKLPCTVAGVYGMFESELSKQTPCQKVLGGYLDLLEFYLNIEME